MAGKSETIFQQVYNAVNKKRGEQGGGALPDGSLRTILKEEGVSDKDWYAALARAKKQTPNLYELIYKSLGKEPPKPRDTAPVEEEEAEPAGAPSVSDVLANILAWLTPITNDDRRRVLAAVTAFFPETVE